MPQPAEETKAEDALEAEPSNDVGEQPEYEPMSIDDTIAVDPPEPKEGELIEVRAGPLTFRNGCEGIEKSWHEGPDPEGRIILSWRPRSVPEDAMCTMALHSEWIEVRLEGLPAGDYSLVVPGVGEKAFKVEPRSE